MVGNSSNKGRVFKTCQLSITLSRVLLLQFKLYRQHQFDSTSVRIYSVVLHSQDINKMKINWRRRAYSLLGKVLHGLF